MRSGTGKPQRGFGPRQPCRSREVGELMGRLSHTDVPPVRDPLGMKMVLVGSRTAEPGRTYSDAELERGWQLYREELMRARPAEELWGYWEFEAQRRES